MFRPNFSAKKKNVVQPTRIFCTSRISWKRISDWLPNVFHFGTENWEEQLKKAPCIMPWRTIPDKGILLHFATQVNLLSPVAGLHVALTANKDEERR